MATKKPFVVKHGLDITGNTSITGSILPTSNNIYDLGSVDMVWRDVYIGPGSLYVNGKKVIEDNSDTITITTDLNQNLKVRTSGSGVNQIEAEAGGISLSTNDGGDIIVDPDGNLELRGTLQLQSGRRIIDSAGIGVEFGDNIVMNNNRIRDIGAPALDSDAATKGYVDTAVANLVDSAPGALNTLNELAAALGDDADFATSVTNTIGSLRTDTNVLIASVNTAIATVGTALDTQEAKQASDLANTNARIATVESDIATLESTVNTNAATASADIATKLDAADYNAADVLTKIKTVDGATSGLDADLLDGQHGTHYLDFGNFTGVPSPQVTLSGDVTGSATLTELGNATIIATVADDSHNHIIANVDGLQDALDGKADDADVTASAILTKIKTVDGAGSGLDADLLDGQSSAYYATAASVTAEASARASAISSEATTRADADDALWSGILATNTAVRAYTDSAIANLVDSAPATLDTLNELAAALGDDPNFATTLSTNLGQKLGASASITLTGDVSGSGSFSSNAVSISVSVADDSHNHVISNVDGLQGALDAKAPTARAINTGTGLTGGGNLTTNRTLSLSHLGLESLTDPNADRIAFWDDSVGSFSWLAMGTNLSISGSTLNATDTNTTYSAGAGLDLSGTSFSVENDLRGDVFTIGRDSNDYYTVGTTVHDWYLDGVLDMRLQNDGTLHVDGDVVAYSTTTSSDRKLKEDIVNVENAIEKVKQLNGVEFTWKKDGSRAAGVIAQDVEAVLPQAVKEVEDLNGDDTHKVVDYNALHSIMIEAIKEQQAQIEELTKRVEELSK